MKIVKLHTITSTNDYLKQWSKETSLDNFTVVVTNNQTKGKGFMGNVWEAKPYENLTFSVFLDTSFLSSTNQFYLNIITSLAVKDLLRNLNILKTKIKWPNDIMSHNQKICGILIENRYQHNKLTNSVIGVGLNINQEKFNESFNATSLKLISGEDYNLELVLDKFLILFKEYFNKLKRLEFLELKMEYEKALFRKGKPSTFKNAKGNLFMGFIQGVSDAGKLIVLLEDEIKQEFDLKEIQLLY